MVYFVRSCAIGVAPHDEGSFVQKDDRLPIFAFGETSSAHKS